MIERNFDVPFVANLSLREKQIQQNYRPVISVHKWFARRPGTLFRSLLLAEFVSEPLPEAFYRSNNLPGLHIADPFMGGGIPLLEANRMGCKVTGFDINPMAYWIVKQEIEHIDLNVYEETAQSVRKMLEDEIGHLYRTRCVLCGNAEAQVKYFFWVKTKKCQLCATDIDLFPGYLLAKNIRHPQNVFICSKCGELTETQDRRDPGSCKHCGDQLIVDGPAKRNRCKCQTCNSINIYPKADTGFPRHRLFAIEYYCPHCRNSHNGRFFKKADNHDLDLVREAEVVLQRIQAKFIPDDEILAGDETNRLHRWGYRYYREMFNPRQLLGLELSAKLVTKVTNERIRNALATNFSDLLRYQNMLCRYDTMALKSLDIFSVHGFPIGLIQCESNLLGIIDSEKTTCIGSGGWANIIEKFRKAKAYCNHPFEIRHYGQKKEVVPIEGEWIGDQLNDLQQKKRPVNIFCANAAAVEIPAGTLDAVFTDPPYFGNVQYAELMDFCYVWLRRIVGKLSYPFAASSTRNKNEFTGNDNMGKGLSHFTEGISAVFQRMAIALKPGSPLAFTYHHNDIKAYYPIAVAILDAKLVCSASLPCPAEMGASIHINGTGSSIIDTIFVCRSTGRVPRQWLPETLEGVLQLVVNDLEKLKAGNVKPTAGDIRCITYGHLIRLAIWNLRTKWNKNLSTEERLTIVANWLQKFVDWSEVEQFPARIPLIPKPTFKLKFHEQSEMYGVVHGDISF